MDIICPRCGEPWDMDSLHEADVKPYARAAKVFRTKGCGAVFSSWGVVCEPAVIDPDGDDVPPTMAAQMAFELMGDDIDGVASFLDDMGYTR